jgi:hypothetical protein
MFTWNDPYVLAVILGLIAVVVFHFDQKQKKVEVEKSSYFKVFILVSGLIFAFNYFVLTNSVETTLLPTEKILESVPVSAPFPVKTLSQSPTSAFTPIQSASTLGGLYGNLKIKEGPPNF